jgi:proton-translocating NAD(P)+ transhydrogenase subunit beta
MTDWSPLVDAVYVVAVIFFILGLRAMSSPETARRGIVQAGAAMFIAVVVTFLVPGLSNFALIAIGIILGGGAGWYWARVVKMTAMPQMVAVFNGMGGGAAAAIAAIALLSSIGDTTEASLSVAGAVIGAVSIAGSVIAFLKLQGTIRSRPIVFPAQTVVNTGILALGILFGILSVWQASPLWLPLFFLFALLYGILLTLPIGGADMPVVISMFNALTGIAVALDGFALVNGAFGDAGYALVVAGTLVGAAGTMLTVLMARAMNRSISNVFFSAFGAKEEEGVAVAGSLKPISAEDAAVMMEYAEHVIIAPGYGMAVAQAQHAVRELEKALEAKGVTVKFAIHPVAGRMPGHMNVLLAEADVPYDLLREMDEINPEFPRTDVTLVIGANDVTNPAAKNEPGSPIYGMPILEVNASGSVIVLKRSMASGFAGIDNPLFYDPKTAMLFGDAKQSVSDITSEVQSL